MSLFSIANGGYRRLEQMDIGFDVYQTYIFEVLRNRKWSRNEPKLLAKDEAGARVKFRLQLQVKRNKDIKTNS